MTARQRAIPALLLLLALCALQGAAAQPMAAGSSMAMRIVEDEQLDCARVLIPVGTRAVVFSSSHALDSAFRAHPMDGPCSTAKPPRFDPHREWLAGAEVWADCNAVVDVGTVVDSALHRVTLVVLWHYGGSRAMCPHERWYRVARPGPEWTLDVSASEASRSSR